MAQFKRKDGYALMTLVVKELTGQDIGNVVNTEGFINAGSLIADYTTDEIFNAIGIVYGRLAIAVRSYNAKLWLINSIDNDMYSNRMRKISVYSNFPLPSGHFNTDIYTNLAAGFDNGTNPTAGGVAQSTGSMFEQHPMYPLELNFSGSTTWQEALTRYIDQIKICVRDENEWLALWNGIVAQKNNDIELQKEAYNRMTLLGRIGYALAIGDDSSAIKGTMTKVNLTKAFNDYFNPVTPYTSQELRTTYLKEFCEFLSVTIKDYSDMMTRPSVYFHAAPVYTDSQSVDHVILRHTEKSRQRLMLFSPFWNRAKAMVMPELFNEEYIDMANFEAVDFWAANSTDIDTRATVNVKVTVPGWLESLITSGSTTTDTAYTASDIYVLGCLFDVDSVMTSYQLESVEPAREARKGYITDWYTFARNSISDPTENFIVFTMEDPATP